MLESLRNMKPWAKVLCLFGLWMLIGGLVIAFTAAGMLTGADAESKTMQAVSQLIMFLGTAVLYVWLFEGQPLTHLKVAVHGRQWLNILTALVIMVLLLPVIDIVAQWNDSWNLGMLEEPLRKITDMSKQLMEGWMSDTTVWGFVSNLIEMAVVPAICEEAFFRGALQQSLGKWFRNSHVAIIVTALIFSLVHGDIYGFVPRVIMGVVLGYLFHYGGSIWVNIAAHCLNNAIIVVIYFLNGKGVSDIDPEHLPEVGTFWALAMTGAAVLVFYVTMLMRRKAKN